MVFPKFSLELPLPLGRRRECGKEHEIPKAENIHWRHEWKYMVPLSAAEKIRMRIRAVAELDAHAQEDGHYRIRSLYFDNYCDMALKEKLNGINPREKFRIRYYDGEISHLFLEKKYKSGRLSAKFTEPISREVVDEILDDTLDLSFADNQMSRELETPLLCELYGKRRILGLRPVSVVEYIRVPYEYEAGNVRVTFDYDLRTTWNPEEFLDPDCDMIPADYPPRMTGDILTAGGYGEEGFQTGFQSFRRGRPLVLMEVKWARFLPAVIQDAIGFPGLSATAFSKYAQCRAFR